ncbi:hypothetical protein C0V97_07200 [Asaia sp. W19]|uniref:hypothetical protein n=1 Tax=unclassified Asaia TaxID=2685023 RepID=UPI000F8F783E|nr:hypothetical protein [Asaia sp. W19]RUT26162.1 hypothetical protein C0V97_07200 [Asaia sp. W19]
MSDALLLLSPGPYKLDLQLTQPDNPSSTVGMSGAIVDTALLTVGTGPFSNALSVPGVVSRSIGDQLDIIQSANASSQLAAGQLWGTAKLTEDSSEFGNVTRGNTFDVAPGTAVSAVLPSGQNSVASFPSDTAISQPRMRFLSEETALRVAPQTQNNMTIVTDSRPNSLLRSVGGSSAAVDQLKEIIVATQGRPYQTSDDAWVQAQLDSINRGQTTVLQVRQSLAQWSAEHGEYDSTYSGVHGRPPSDADRQYAATMIGNGWSLQDYRSNEAYSDDVGRTIRALYRDVGNVTANDGQINSWKAGLTTNTTYAEMRATIANNEGAAALDDLAHSALSRSFTSEELSAYKAQLVDGKSLDDIEAFIRRSIFSDPSLYGPNLAINTQGVINGQVQYNGYPSSLNGDTSPDWGVIQWKGQSALDPAAGTSSQVWDKNFGNSVGHWTQGSATSSAGKTEYNVFRDPKDGHYVYQMAAQGGNLLDVQLATLGSVDHRYSFDHQITASLDQGISDYQGYSGAYQAGVNFTINYHSDNLNFGIFLQFESIDYTGRPGSYSSLQPGFSGSIFNISGSQAAYINPLLKQNDGVMYHTEININQGLMSVIGALVAKRPEYAAELQDMSNWYLNSVYIGVETIGSGRTSDVTGKYNVKDPIVTYNQDKKVSYTDKSRDAAIVTMTPIPKA